MTPFHVRTPLFRSRPLEKRLGMPVQLKMESFQPTGSFKIRGLGLLCQEAAAGGATQLVSSSGGNAGLAVAYAGSRLGIRASVIVPETTPGWMRERIAGEGATVEVHGAVWDEADRAARDRAAQDDGAYIPPFDHPTIWRGHATLIEEAAEAMSKPGIVVVAVGGGGLLCGVLQGLQKAGWSDVPALAVETEGTASLAASIRAGKLVALDAIRGIATSLGARQVAKDALAWTTRHRVISHVVTDAAAARACLAFADDHRVLVEAACGAALSAAYDGAEALRGADSALVVVCGGVLVTRATLAEWEKLVQPT